MKTHHYGPILLALIVALVPGLCRGEAAWMWHEEQSWENQEYFRPLRPGRETAVTLQVKIGWPTWIDHACIYVTADGSEPLGAFGVAAPGTMAIPMEWHCTVPDPDPEHDADMWIGTIPAQEVGTRVTYRISSWHSGGGLERFANNMAHLAQDADHFIYVVRGESQGVVGELQEIRARIFVDGVTPGDGPGPGLEVQLWHDLQGAWQGSPMSYQQEAGDGELWGIGVQPDSPGRYHHLTRYRVGLEDWSYLGDPAQPAEMGQLIVDPAWIRDTVLYQVFPRVHGAVDANGDGQLENSEFGDLQGVLADLPRIVDLGVGALWLMPIHPLSTDPAYLKSSDGGPGSPYAPLDIRSVNPDYGDEQDLRELVDAAHDAGLKVLLGFVPNHMSPDNVLIPVHRNWFEGDPGPLQPDDPDWWDTVAFNYDCQDPGDPVECNPDWSALWTYVTDTVAYWMEDVGVDGYRMDMASLQPLDFWEQAIPDLRARAPEHFLLAEAYHVQGPLEAAGFGSVYESAFYRFVHDRLKPGDAQARDLWDALDAQAIWEIPGRLPMRYVENHDETRAAAEFGLEGAKALAGFLLTSRCIPMLYSGQEYGASDRIPLFRGIHGLETYPAPDPDAAPEVTAWYRSMIHTRNQHVALRRGEMRRVPCTSPYVIGHLRSHPNELILAVINLDLAAGTPHTTLLSLPRAGLGIPDGWSCDLLDLLGTRHRRVRSEDLDLLEVALAAHEVLVQSVQVACPYGGDVQQDGRVDQLDARLILLDEVGRIELDSGERCRADLDLDFQATHRDAVILRAPSGATTGEPCMILRDAQVPEGGSVEMELALEGGAGVRGGWARLSLESSSATVLAIRTDWGGDCLWVSDRSTPPAPYDPLPPEPAVATVGWAGLTDPAPAQEVAWIQIGVADLPAGTRVQISLEAELCDAQGNEVAATVRDGTLTVVGDQLGVRIEAPAWVHPGEEFRVDGWLDNPGEDLQEVPTFFLLEVWGQYWFWPSWAWYAPPESAELDYRLEPIPHGSRRISVVPSFVWPDTGPTTVDGLFFYGAMLNQELSEILGEPAVHPWGYGPPLD